MTRGSMSLSISLETIAVENMRDGLGLNGLLEGIYGKIA